MLRFLFRLWLALVLFFIGLLFGRRPRQQELNDDSPQRFGSRRGRRSRPVIDRGDVVDVPFTEIPPPGESTGPDRSESSRPERSVSSAAGFR